MEINKDMPLIVEDILNEISEYANDIVNYDNSIHSVKYMFESSNNIFDKTMLNLEKLRDNDIPNKKMYLILILDKLTESIIIKNSIFFEKMTEAFKSGRERLEVFNSNLKTLTFSNIVLFQRLEVLPLSKEIKDQLLQVKELYKAALYDLNNPKACYVATMAYGNYSHPKVLVLRKFRDEVLDQSAFGKWFIKTYYHYSPKLVERLKEQKAVNSIIRKALNQFIKFIK
jgi:hypothetical protein